MSPAFHAEMIARYEKTIADMNGTIAHAASMPNGENRRNVERLAKREMGLAEHRLRELRQCGQ